MGERPVIDQSVVCACGHRRPIQVLPMFVITGASGAGKTTVGNELLGQITDPVVLDCDILWSKEMDTPEDGYARFRSTWLSLAINVHQSGRSTLLIGSGTPEGYESRPERAYVGPIHWMALVCDDDALETRLRERPAWARGHRRFRDGHASIQRPLASTTRHACSGYDSRECCGHGRPGTSLATSALAPHGLVDRGRLPNPWPIGIRNIHPR
jgi:hypothetical protein